MKTPASAAANPSLRERLRVLTSRAILDAAEVVFATQGLQAARMEDVAARAGVAVGTLYNYFKDRQTLVTSLHAYRHQEVIELFEQCLAAGADRPFDALLLEVVRILLGHFDRHRAFFVVLMQSEAELGRREAMCARRQAILELRGCFERVVARGVAEGAMRADDAAIFPSALFALLQSAMMHAHFNEATTPAAEQAAALVRLFLDGARPRPAAG
ncbi:MAG: TetR family transcriptional regulator [Myxococcaceae bacterium]|nr:TetR family transcriptional regulator [Myxococcaceae bacterium]